MPRVHSYKTICEYCLAPITYDPSILLKDKFDVIYTICPMCESQVEVACPDDIDEDTITLDFEQDLKDNYSRDDNEDID